MFCLKTLNAVVSIYSVWFNNKEEAVFVFRPFCFHDAKLKQRLHLRTLLSFFVREMHCVCCAVGCEILNFV